MSSREEVKGEEVAEQIKENDSNLTQLFEVHFERTADRQQNLLLNQVKDMPFKRILMSYLKTPQIAIHLKEKLKKDPFIQEYHDNLQKEGFKKKRVDDIYQEFLKAMGKKQSSKSESEPLTCYKEYVNLSQSIQKSFTLKKEGKTKTKETGKCGFKMKSRQHSYQQMCEFCEKKIQNIAGLHSHYKSCVIDTFTQHKLKSKNKPQKTKRITRRYAKKLREQGRQMNE